MRGGGPLEAEIVERRHDATAEEGLPLPVDRHSGGERMLRGDKPLGQRQPTGVRALRQAGEKCWYGRSHLLTGLRVFAAVPQKSLPRVVGGAFAENECCRPTAKLRLKPADLLHRLDKLRRRGEKPAPHGLHFSLGPFRGRLPQGRLFRGREPAGLGATGPRDREPEATERAGVMALELHPQGQRRPRGHRLGEGEHRRMRPPLIAIGTPAARHVAVEGQRCGALGTREGCGAVEGICRRGHRHPRSSRRDLELREEKISLRTLVPAHPRAIGREARVGEDFEADRPDGNVGGRKNDLVVVALGDIAAGEN